ncbi:hypothetical protein LSH36_38g01015 [Paralvinella palmiformis]|uniref:Uncharacterized protein n=1 Tax=Paralvinella palmiformis TaxID=53620 RepID=A0AAD9K8M1_9ANNE|nr:hypothetical protein LSH36_38g01015 [Paralvinella palmiformis]
MSVYDSQSSPEMTNQSSLITSSWTLVNETNMEKRQNVRDYWSHMEKHMEHMRERLSKWNKLPEQSNRLGNRKYLNQSLQKYPNPDVKMTRDKELQALK